METKECSWQDSKLCRNFMIVAFW